VCSGGELEQIQFLLGLWFVKTLRADKGFLPLGVSTHRFVIRYSDRCYSNPRARPATKASPAVLIGTTDRVAGV
jgi:hypothetical protein